MDVVEGKSAGSGQSNDVRGTGQSPRITPRFLATDEGDTVTSSTVTDRSIGGQSYPGMQRSSVLQRLSLR